MRRRADELDEIRGRLRPGSAAARRATSPGAPEPPPADAAGPEARPNRRESYRCRPARGSAVVCRALLGGWGVAASVLDASLDGIRMLIGGGVDVGDHLALEVHGAGGAPRRLLAYVVWAVPAAGGKCCFGARFLRPLTVAQLTMLARF